MLLIISCIIISMKHFKVVFLSLFTVICVVSVSILTLNVAAIISIYLCVQILFAVNPEHEEEVRYITLKSDVPRSKFFPLCSACSSASNLKYAL